MCKKSSILSYLKHLSPSPSSSVPSSLHFPAGTPRLLTLGHVVSVCDIVMFNKFHNQSMESAHTSFKSLARYHFDILDEGGGDDQSC